MEVSVEEGVRSTLHLKGLAESLVLILSFAFSLCTARALPSTVDPVTIRKHTAEYIDARNVLI